MAFASSPVTMARLMGPLPEPKTQARSAHGQPSANAARLGVKRAKSGDFGPEDRRRGILRSSEARTG